MPFYGVFPNKPKSGTKKTDKKPKNNDLANAVNASLGLPQKFDAGGGVFKAPDTFANSTAGMNTSAAQTASNFGKSDTFNPGNAILPAVGAGVQSISKPIFDMVTNMANPIGNAAQSIGSSFTAQNGFQAQLAPTTNLDYTGLINQAGQQALSGYGANQNILQQQQGLANLQNQGAMGGGPNPALNQLAQTTGQNAAQQAALMASARGASSNPGLIARQAAATGANLQQQAAGQAATLRSQQQLAQQGALGQTLAQMGGLNTGEQGINANLFGSGTGALNTQNANAITNLGNAQGINAQVAQNNANAVNKTTAGLLGGAGSMLSSLMAEGGEVASPNTPTLADGSASSGGSGGASGGGSALSGAGSLIGLAAMLSEGGQAQRPSAVQFLISNHGVKKMAVGGKTPDQRGGTVPGTAKVKGDNYSNDTVPALLSAGEIVLPRSVTMSNDPVGKAADFVRAIKARKGNRGLG